MKRVIVLIIFFFLCNPSFAKDLSEEVGLSAKIGDSCNVASPNMRTHASVAQESDEFDVSLIAVLNCAYKVKDPKFYISEFGITLALDAISESGLFAACQCTNEVKFSFTIPDFKDYVISKIYFTINQAVVAEAEILNKAVKVDR